MSVGKIKTSNLAEKVLALGSKAIKEIYTRDYAMEDSKNAFAAIANNNFNAPIRSFVKTPNQDLTIMPASVTSNSEVSLAVKILSIVPKNRERGLPLIPGKLLLFNEETGMLKALMDGGMITNLRTGATAGITSKILHPAPAKVAMIFGCGAQGNYGLDSILFAHPEVEKVYCYDYFPNFAQKYAENHKALNDGREYIAVQDIESAVREADIIHCATTSTTELFKGDWVKDGAHISAIGCYRLDMRELPADLFKRDNVKLYVDQYNVMKEESGDIMNAINLGILKEENIKLFGDIINGKDSGRTDNDQITVAKFVGLAPQDTIAANTIYKLAVQKGAGLEIDMNKI